VNSTHDDHTLITTESGSTLTLRAATTLEVVAEIPQWTAFGATIVGDAAWAVNAGTVLRGSFATRVVDETTTLPSQSTGQVIALLEPVEVAAAEAQLLVTPRAPGQLTDPAPATTPDVESSSDADPSSSAPAPSAGADTGASSSAEGSLLGVALIAVAVVVLAAAIAVWWRRSRRTTLPA
jgi:hypothetical protein